MPKALQISDALKKFPRSIIVKFKDSLGIPYKSDEETIRFLETRKILSVRDLRKRYPGVKLQRLFSSTSVTDIQDIVKLARSLTPTYRPTNFLSYCTMICSHQTKFKSLLKELNANKHIEFAYLTETPAPLPLCNMRGQNVLHTKQGYLDAAPTGIDARFAWSVNGGCGSGVSFIDIEYGWNLNQEDIRGVSINVVNNPFTTGEEAEHGTAVLGIILMQDNNKGGIGIARKAATTVVSVLKQDGTENIPNALMEATNRLNAGDVMLLEIQLFQPENGLDRLLPLEADPLLFELVQLATSKGIVVVEVSGNGDGARRGVNLDRYKDENGINIFRRRVRDSGAIIVAAGKSALPHRKVANSNFGNRVDCYAWGENVTTAGRPGSNPPPQPDYTDTFNGSSSASAIIAGAVIVIQSALKAAGKPKLNPNQMRSLISNPANGTPSPNRIGIMPDLKKILGNLNTPL